ncbi:hypothetical protein D3Z31_10970 [Lactobacillus murinus]|nr:hypothetical protein [Ligilactobacillus murinus]RII75989.1 hypothetical protein D1870_10970 [Ligilactobacillus murinus]
MAIETWDSPYILIWLCLGILVIVLTFGTRGYSDKLNGLEAAFYSVVIGGLAILNGAVLGQVMYDKTAKYDVLGALGNTLGLSGSLLVSGFILLIFYRCRIVKNPDEIVIREKELEISGSYLLSGITALSSLGLLLLGIGIGHIVYGLKAGRAGFFYGSLPLIPFILGIILMTKYSKWMFKYIIWVLRRKGLLQVVNDKEEEPK